MSPGRPQKWDGEPRIPERRSPVRSYGGTLFTEPVLLVSRQPEAFGTSQEYGVYDQHGTRVGGVADVSHGFLLKAARLLPKYDQYVTHKFEVRDANHSTVLKVTRPAKDPRPRFLVTRADETPIGEILCEPTSGKSRFTFVAGGSIVGRVVAADWRTGDIAIKNQTNAEVARVRQSPPKSASNLPPRTYVVEIPLQLPEPLASMVVATTLTIDTALARAIT